MAHLLGIDIGTSSTKALLCDENGSVLMTATADYAVSSPKTGWSEQDPEHWWQAVCVATQAALLKAGIHATDVTAIGLSGQMHGSVFLGDGFKPLRPAILWNDQRTVDQCLQITEKAGGRQKLITMVANPALTGFTAPKVLWVRQHEPKIYDKTRHLLLPKDYIRLRLTGEYATDLSDASGMLLLDVARRTWSRQLLERLDIDKTILPRLYESPDITGTLTRDAAVELGLKEGIPVVAGAGDQAAGAVGNGIVKAGIVSATLGTSGVIFAYSDQPTRDPRGRVHTMCHAVPGKWCVFGCMLAAGGSFQWFRDELGFLEVEAARMMTEKGKATDPYELLIREAEAAPAGAGGLFFLPYLTGERCPHPDPYARGAWIGLTHRTNRDMMVRALLEGITYGMRDVMEILHEMDIPIRQVRASGGGARSEFWRQLQADVYRKPIVTTSVAEGPAYGAALLAGVGTRIWKNVHEACTSALCPKQTLSPRKKLAALYDHHYSVYRKLYDDLKERFAEISAMYR